MRDWIWGDTPVEKPETHSGALHIIVTNRDGETISRRMLLVDENYRPSELEMSLEVRLREIARDITVRHCGYKVKP